MTGGPVGFRGSTLLAGVVRELARGPRHARELAREVLGLSGNLEVAERAVAALLEGDERFRVDDRGYWSLAGGGGGASPPLSRLSFAVVDVETTGGSWRGEDRITEVAVVHLDGGRVTDRFESLVDPERPIPSRIQALTGITDEMVAGAPPFPALAAQLAVRLENRVFVAHNAPFDWGFVARELERAGRPRPAVERLCTVRLGRRLLPELRSHALDALSEHLGVRVRGRHRAGGDALATARILLQLLEEAEARGVGTLEELRGARSPRGTGGAGASRR